MVSCTVGQNVEKVTFDNSNNEENMVKKIDVNLFTFPHV